jgi:GNAT superfamily N-acetyltransferase
MPNFRILKSGDEGSMEAFLVPRIQSSMFLIGNSRLSGLEDYGEAYQGTYAAAYEDNWIVAVAAHYWNGMLVLQAPDHVNELVRTVLSVSGRPVKGLIGPITQVERAGSFLGLNDEDIQLDSKEYLYSLDLDALKVPDILAAGTVKGRLIEEGDIDMVSKWEIAYMREATGEADSPRFREQCRETVQRSVQERRAWILESDGRPVARTTFNSVLKEAVQVGGVWTPPEYRSRGYARALVAFSLLEARSRGVSTAILFTDEKNYPARKAYEALGFRHIGDYRLLFLKASIRKFR